MYRAIKYRLYPADEQATLFVSFYLEFLLCLKGTRKTMEICFLEGWQLL